VAVKYLIVGDPHLRVSALKTGKQLLQFLLDVQCQHCPDVVILLGDQLDTHSVMRIEVVRMWVDYLKQCNVPHIMLKGNHDETSPGSNQHGLVAFEKWAKVIDEPKELAGNGYIQYIHNEADFKRAVDSIPDGVGTLFCHQTFSGAQYENGWYDPNGFDPACVSRFRKVVSGHIHKRQQIGNIFYVGTPAAMNFNDAGETKGVYLMEDDRYTFIESPCPKYVLIETDDPSSIKLGSVEDKYKIILHQTRARIEEYLKSREYLDLKRQYSLVFVPKYTDTVVVTIRTVDRLTPAQVLEKYIDGLMTNLDRAKLASMAQSILSQSSVK
jgi:DNA repair exonuclease SbcCD nuclease subunit